MLILTRKIGETIKIGDDISIVVLQQKKHSKSVKIGINAPKHISVHRDEIYERIQLEKSIIQQQKVAND